MRMRRALSGKIVKIISGYLRDDDVVYWDMGENMSERRQNVSKVVMDLGVEYVEPANLIRFFVKYGLDIDMKFAYDAFGCELSVELANNIFSNFPNIVVTGLHLVEVRRWKIGVLNFALDKLKKLRLDGKVDRCFDPHYDEVYLRELDGLKECRNLVRFEICNFEVDNLDNLKECVKLRYVVIENCWCDLKLEGLGGLRELKVLSLNNCDIEGNLKCFSLRRLVLSSWKVSNKCVVDVDLNTFKECSQLRSVYLSAFEKVRGIEMLGNLKELRRVRIGKGIGGVGGMKDVENMLKGCHKLKEIRLGRLDWVG